MFVRTKPAVCVISVLGAIFAAGFGGITFAQPPTYTIDQGVALADSQNPDILIARKKLEAARGGLIEARSGYLPSVISSGFADKRQTQTSSDLREEDYNASVRALENVYTGGAVSNQVAIAELNIEKQRCALEEVQNKVAMDVRVGFYDVLLNRAKVRVRENSVQVLNEEVKTQDERLKAGIVGNLNVRRAQVALANEQPELANAKTELGNSYLRLGELFGIDYRTQTAQAGFEVAGQLQYAALHPDLNQCLGRADAKRAEIRAREIDVAIEDHQLRVDQSELRPHVQLFSGYEVYSERDPNVGPEFNHGYLVGVNGTWHLFDGFATKGRMQATRARREGAAQALEAARRSVASEVRSAFLDLQQADNVLQSETKNVQTADESLEITKSNLAAGLGTQLDILQAAADVTRTRTTRLSAIYLHNVALARLARACGSTPEALDFASNKLKKKNEQQAVDVARPPAKISSR
ncbi:MAG TPA: TolC family protein [Chthoniobacterales bacterium]|nr:TolC family protein [Chthoniobacterales bacterium]